ncbi:MAG TPA: type I-B CRISPR-associated protein Cas7/Csh2 [Saprospiraceae bacterium]|nr:type I-B CRISPR-associated protein Cas7/Csh2 [Saprospiraceae bacterium]
MAETLTHRHEILFVYDVKDANPNGDPIDENKPRIDEETGVNIVTDVRLKRTIRDFLYENKGMEIFVREIEYEPGLIQDAKMRALDFVKEFSGINKEQKEVLDLYLDKKKKIKKKHFDIIKNIARKNLINFAIDVRLFGATVPFEINKSKIEDSKEDLKSSITLTGPVQFKMGRSLHRVDIKFIKGTGAFASKPGKGQSTFREEYILPYSLIVFHGIANENAAKHTGMTDSDLDLLMEAIWNGTKNLISRSKFGQMPRLLLDIEYKEPHFHIGDLDKLVAIKKEDGIEDEALRDISQLTLNILPLVEALQREKEKIVRIRYKIDERLEMAPAIAQFSQLLESVPLSSFSF